MCLGVPGRVLQIDGLDATVDFFGVSKRIRLDIVDETVAVGDYVLNHVGFAIRRIPEAEVGETLALFDSILHGTAGDDLMAADVLGEIDAAGPEVNRARAAGGERDAVEAFDAGERQQDGATPERCPVFLPEAPPAGSGAKKEHDHE